jgi:hypothetical protein
MIKARKLHLMKCASYAVGLLFLCYVSLAYAAGSVKLTSFVSAKGVVQAIVWAWTSDGSGDVSGNDTFTVQGNVKIYGFATDPESGVSADYDIVVPASIIIPTESGTRTIEWADVLGGDGADCSNSTDGTVAALTTTFTVVDGTTLDLDISNAGNATSGTFVLFFSEE